MFRKLTALALLAAGIAAAIKKRGGAQSSDPAPSPADAAPAPTPASEPTAEQPEPAAEDLAEVRSGQTQDTIESPVAGVGDDEQAVIPDTSADDPLVRQQEDAARADAGSIGGEADTVSADVDPEMRPVYEGSGGDPETFETTDEQGR